MSWEIVRDIGKMPDLLLIVRNLCMQNQAPKEVIENIEDVSSVLKEVQQEIREGKKI